MRATLADDRLARYAGRFVWLALDFDRPQNQEFLARRGVTFTPTFFVLDPSDERATAAQFGALTLSGLSEFLERGERTVRAKAMTPADVALARGDELLASGKTKEAADAYHEALRLGDKSWRERDRAVSSFTWAALTIGQSQTCSEIAVQETPLMKRTENFGRVVLAGLSCVNQDPSAAWAAEARKILEPLAAEAIALPVTLRDHRFQLYQQLMDSAELRGDKTTTKDLGDRWLKELDATNPKNDDERSALDVARVDAASALDTPERVIPALIASERAMPRNYNASLRLAQMEVSARRYGAAVAACDRGLRHVSGPLGRTWLLQTKADAILRQGKLVQGRQVLKQALHAARMIGVKQARDRNVEKILKLIKETEAGSRARVSRECTRWIGTWATSAQPSLPKPEIYQNRTLRLIVHISVGGHKLRIRLSNTYGDQPLFIGAAHIARRTAGADVDPASDRTLMFDGHSTMRVPARSTIASDPVELDVPALSDLAISIFLPRITSVTTTHNLAKQTNYISAETGDHTSDVKFPIDRKTRSWPFLTGVDVVSSRGAVIVAFGSSLTDGDGTTSDTNQRWPDILTARLQKAGGYAAELGVLNEGIIGNRLLNGSPTRAAGGRFGALLGQSGLARFQRDVLDEPGVKYVIVDLGINDIIFPGSLTPAAEDMTAAKLIAGYRQLIVRAHKRGIRIIGTTISPFENAFLALPPPEPVITFYTAEKESVRQKVNRWIRRSGELDGVVDFDKVLRNPTRPTQLLASYDSGDHLHPNDAGSIAKGNAFRLSLFEGN
jgi:lysophospholipase L1-like esterase